MKKCIRVKFILLLIPIFTLSACVDRDVTYTGYNPELFSVGIHSLLGVRGFGRHYDIAFIETLDEDNYGRILFSYNENMVYSWLIIQKVDGGYAYFYPYYNFILTSLEHNWEFTIEEMEALKEANSWNQPMSDISEFERVPIVRLKEEGPTPHEILVEAYSELFPHVQNVNRRNISYRMNFLRMDRYGRAVYFTGIRIDGNRMDYAVLFQPDHSFDLETGVLEITDMNNYQTVLRLFMEANGWNEPWDE